MQQIITSASPRPTSHRHRESAPRKKRPVTWPWDLQYRAEAWISTCYIRAALRMEQGRCHIYNIYMRRRDGAWKLEPGGWTRMEGEGKSKITSFQSCVQNFLQFKPVQGGPLVSPAALFPTSRGVHTFLALRQWICRSTNPTCIAYRSHTIHAVDKPSDF